MPQVFDVGLSGGYRRNGVMAAALFEWQHMTSGGDIRRQDAPFISKRMNATRIGVMGMYPIPKLEALAWMGLWCTPDTPAVAQARVREATLKVLTQPAVRDRMLELGFEVAAPRSIDEMIAGLKADYDRVGAVLQSIGFKPE